MVGGIFYEHGHRMIASFVGILTIVLAVWLWRAEDRRWVKYLGLAALGAVILQGVLGGLTVLFLLPAPVSVAHACLAQLFFCLVVSLALATAPGWRRERRERLLLPKDEGWPPLRYLCLGANAAILLQLLLGAAFRHKASGLAPHLIGAAAVMILVLWVIARVMSEHAGEAPLFRWSLALNGLLMAQLILGGAAYWVRAATGHIPQPQPAMIALTVAHVALGAVLLATSVVLTIQAYSLLSAGTSILQKPELPVTT